MTSVLFTNVRIFDAPGALPDPGEVLVLTGKPPA